MTCLKNIAVEMELLCRLHGNRVESLATDKYTFGAEDGERSFGNICYFYGSYYVVLASLCGEKIHFVAL